MRFTAAVAAGEIVAGHQGIHPLIPLFRRNIAPGALLQTRLRNTEVQLLMFKIKLSARLRYRLKGNALLRRKLSQRGEGFSIQPHHFHARKREARR